MTKSIKSKKASFNNLKELRNPSIALKNVRKALKCALTEMHNINIAGSKENLEDKK